MTYRFFARLYQGCERIVFGNALQKCRTAFLDQCQGRVLSIGEGDGRFSEALLVQNPEVDLKIIEPDETMHALIRERVPYAEFTNLEAAEACDVIVLNFVLDLFNRKEAEAFLKSLPPTKNLIVGDFFPQEVNGTVERFWAKALVWIMYRFFNFFTSLKTRSLPPTRKILTSQGLSCTEENSQWAGLIQAQRWESLNLSE